MWRHLAIAILATICVQFRTFAVTDYDVAGAEGNAAAARGQLEAATHELETIGETLKLQYQSTPGYVKAKADVDTAADALDAARTKVMDTLTSSDEYQAAVKAKEDAVQALRDATSDTSDEERASLAQDAMDARTAVSKLEISALANDPDYQAAKKAAKLASDTLRALDQGLRTFLLSDPGYQHAQAAVDQAQAAVTAADGAAVAEAQAKDKEDTDRSNAEARAEAQQQAALNARNR
jgi:hypothetical protein